MDCAARREQLTADPAAALAGFDRHAAGCAPCRAFRARLLRAESLIAQALDFELADAAAALLPARRPALQPALQSARRPGLGPARRRAGAGSRWVELGAGAAAAVIAVLTLWSLAGAGRQATPDELARAVVEHWAHEPDSLGPGASRVSLNDLAEVMLGAAEMSEPAARRVSFARICRVGGRLMPHLVIQGDTGPFMVLLMPGEALDSPVTLASSDGTLAGRILPRGTGSIAVLGAVAEELDAMESLLATGVDWTERP